VSSVGNRSLGVHLLFPGVCGVTSAGLMSEWGA
jgi:hypothetical protein